LQRSITKTHKVRYKECRKEKTMEVLKPYRARIDALDDKIVDLLVERAGIIREVGHLKFRERIEPVLQDRVDQVRERNADRAAAKGLDPELLRSLYRIIIKFSCDLEESIRQDLRARKASGE
jgi:chorismate mutase